MGKKNNRRNRENNEFTGNDRAESATATQPVDEVFVDEKGFVVADDDDSDELAFVESDEVVPFSTMEQERGDVFKIIRDLESQLESTFSMKEALEADLDSSRKEIGDLRWMRKDLEARVKVLEEESEAASDLQAELSFAEEEKSRAVEQTQDLEAKLRAASDERDTHRERNAELQGGLKDSEKARGDLESQVYRLNEKVRGLEDVQSKLVETRSERDKAVDRIRDLESELEATRTANNALEMAVKHADASTKELRSDKKRLEKALVHARDEKRAFMANSARLEEENEGAHSRIAVLENEISTISARNQTLEAEVDSARKTIGEIHTALADTKAKARKRYYQVKKS